MRFKLMSPALVTARFRSSGKSSSEVSLIARTATPRVPQTRHSLITSKLSISTTSAEELNLNFSAAVITM